MPNPIVGAATAVGIGGSIYGAKKSSDAAKSAARSQERVNLAGIEANKEALERSIGLRQPFIDFGNETLPRLNKLLTSPTTKADIVNNDLYSTLFDNAKRSITANRAAKGKLGSGGTLNALINASLGIGSNIYQQDVNNLFNAVSLGSNASTGAANSVTTATQNNNALLGNIGNAQAASKIARADAFNSGLNNVLGIGAYALSPYLNRVGTT